MSDASSSRSNKQVSGENDDALSHNQMNRLEQIMSNVLVRQDEIFTTLQQHTAAIERSNILLEEILNKIQTN